MIDEEIYKILEKNAKTEKKTINQIIYEIIGEYVNWTGKGKIS